MAKTIFFLFAFLSPILLSAQTSINNMKLLHTKDSMLRVQIHADSVKIEAQYAEEMKWENIKASAMYPVIKAGEYSGVVPVKNITEIPDPNMDYKLLFELTSANTDSAAKNVNEGLMEVARVINLHVAAGIPIKRIMPVLVVHAAALKAIANNAYYQKQYKMDNPNLDALKTLEKMGARIIACGQAMAFYDVTAEDLLKNVKVSLTAQTALSSYQLKGFVLYDMRVKK